MDALRDLQFKEGVSGQENFIKFKTGEAVKLRVFTTDPTIHVNKFGKEQFTFVAWNYTEGRPMLLSKGASIARQIAAYHNDEDFGADITQVDLKILPVGDGMNREYQISVLPKAEKLTDEQLQALTDLDAKLDTIIKSGIRANSYNKGERPVEYEEELSEPDESVDINNIFPE